MAITMSIGLDEDLIPPNHRAVRIGVPKYREMYVECEEDGSDPQARTYMKGDEPIYSPVIIVEEIWQYPEWLGGAGVAMSESGVWWVYDYDPAKGPLGCGKNWTLADLNMGRSVCIFKRHFPLWTPPPCSDWRESWHPNPRYEEKDA